MEIKKQLNKPYAEEERINFIIENNHQNGYEIRTTDSALEAWGYTEEEKQAQENNRIQNLFLTAADVERAIYKAKGLDFNDIVALLETQNETAVDIKALKIELKANNFYRGNPYVNAVGELLGFTPEQLDKFFETGNYKELTTMEA